MTYQSATSILFLISAGMTFYCFYLKYKERRVKAILRTLAMIDASKAHTYFFLLYILSDLSNLHDAYNYYVKGRE